MIGLPPGVRVLVATRPIDFRKGADSLAALADQTLRQDPFSGTVLVFRAKRADRVKIVTWDGTGLVMLWKALDEGVFKWPPISDGVMKLSPAQLSAPFLLCRALHNRNYVERRIMRSPGRSNAAWTGSSGHRSPHNNVPSPAAEHSQELVGRSEPPGPEVGR